MRYGLTQQRFAAPDVQMLHMHAARQYHAQWRRGAASLQQDFALGKGAAAHPQGLYGRGGLRLGQAAEQRQTNYCHICGTFW